MYCMVNISKNQQTKNIESKKRKLWITLSNEDYINFTIICLRLNKKKREILTKIIKEFIQNNKELINNG